MTGPEHYREAEFLAKRAYHYIYGDGADAQVGLGFAAMAQVHATLAQAAATVDSYHSHEQPPADWSEVLS